MIYIYLISVIVSMVVLLGCQWFVMSHYSLSGDVEVNVEDALIMLLSLLASLLPVGNVVVAAMVGFITLGISDIQLFTIKKSKKSPALRKCERPQCPVCRDFH